MDIKCGTNLEIIIANNLEINIATPNVLLKFLKSGGFRDFIKEAQGGKGTPRCQKWS